MKCIYNSCYSFFVWFSFRSPPESVDSESNGFHNINDDNLRVTELSNRSSVCFPTNLSDLTEPGEA